MPFRAARVTSKSFFERYLLEPRGVPGGRSRPTVVAICDNRVDGEDMV